MENVEANGDGPDFIGMQRVINIHQDNQGSEWVELELLSLVEHVVDVDPAAVPRRKAWADSSIKNSTQLELNKLKVLSRSAYCYMSCDASIASVPIARSSERVHSLCRRTLTMALSRSACPLFPYFSHPPTGGGGGSAARWLGPAREPQVAAA